MRLLTLILALTALAAPATIATRLQQADAARATGFALNVSNFRATADELAYGRQVSARGRIR